MFNRDKKSVQVVSFTTGTDITDAYGRKRKAGSASRTVDMDIKVYNQTNVSDVRYINAEYIGLTDDEAITTQNQIMDGQTTYEVLYVVPSRHYTKVMLKKV